MRGHLVKRSKNSWSVVLNLGRDPQTGKYMQQWHTVKGTKKDAERTMAELLHQLDNGTFVKPAKYTVADFLRQWLQDYAISNVRPVSAQGYKQKIEGYVIPALGKIPLTRLQPSHIQAFYREALESGRINGKGGLSPRSVQHIHRILSEALSHAEKWGLVGRNVARAVDPPRVVNRGIRTLDAEEVLTLLKASEGTVYHPLLHLEIHTGLRRSELLALRWRDVDLDMATISVTQVLHCLKGGAIVFNEPKSSTSKRQIDLSPEPVLALRAHRERQELPWLMMGKSVTPDDLVFCHPDCKPFLPNTVSHAFSKLARRVGLHGVRFHDLRHTHATLLLREKIHPKVVQERLGHATISTTLDIYSHVTPGLQRMAAQQFEEALKRDAPKSFGSFSEKIH